MKKMYFLVLLITVITLIIYILPPFGIPMSISSSGASYDIRDSKKKKVFLWEYEIITKNLDNIPLKISEAYCEKQHYWKMNQVIYLPNLYKDESKVQIRVNCQERGKWDEYEIENFNSVNPIGINKEIGILNLTDTLHFNITNKTGNRFVGDITLIKKVNRINLLYKQNAKKMD